MQDLFIQEAPEECAACGDLIQGEGSGLFCWDAASGDSFCPPCAVAGHVGQAASPGRIAGGVFYDLSPPAAEDGAEWATLLNSAGFWRSVWESRNENPEPLRYELKPELRTAQRLAAVDNLLRQGEWPAAAVLLEPVASSWLQADDERERRLWSWQPHNRRRRALLWAELERQCFAAAPGEFQRAALARGYLPPRLGGRWAG